MPETRDTVACASCGKPADSIWTGAGDGKRLHPWCAARLEGFTPYERFSDAIWGRDPVLMRQVLSKCVPGILQMEILTVYNIEAEKAWKRRCEER